MGDACWRSTDRLANVPGAQLGIDPTGGAFNQLTWHGAYAWAFETVLLLIDPEIGGMPYLDWSAHTSGQLTPPQSSPGPAPRRRPVPANFPSPRRRENLADLNASRVEALFGFGKPDDWNSNRPNPLVSGPFVGWPNRETFNLSTWLEANPDAFEPPLAEVLRPEHDAYRPTSPRTFELPGVSSYHPTLEANQRTAMLSFIEKLRAGTVQTLSADGDSSIAVADAVRFCEEKLNCQGGEFLELAM